VCWSDQQANANNTTFAKNKHKVDFLVLYQSARHKGGGVLCVCVFGSGIQICQLWGGREGVIGSGILNFGTSHMKRTQQAEAGGEASKRLRRDSLSTVSAELEVEADREVGAAGGVAQAEYNLRFVKLILQRYEALSNFFVQSHLQLASVVNSLSSTVQLHRLNCDEIMKTVQEPGEIMSFLEATLSERETPCFELLRTMDDSWRDCIEELGDIKHCCSEFVNGRSTNVMMNQTLETRTFGSKPVELFSDDETEDGDGDQRQVESIDLLANKKEEEKSLEDFLLKRLQVPFKSIDKIYRALYPKTEVKEILPAIEFLISGPLQFTYLEVGEMAVNYPHCLEVTPSGLDFSVSAV
jgi:hypothetical protein